MNKIKFMRYFILMLVLCLVIGMMPVAVFAAGFGDKGYDTTLDGSYIIDGNDIFTYVTGSGGTVERISGGDDDSVQQYQAVPENDWEFAYWSTYYSGPATQGNNPVATLGYYYFSKPGDEDSVFDKNSPVIQVNEEMWAAGTYYLQAIFKPKVSVTVNRNLSGSGQSIRGTSSANNGFDNVFISGNSGYVPFGGSVQVALTAFKSDYIVQSITVHDGAPRNDFTYNIQSDINELHVLFTATRPTNVQINVKIKEQIVAFDANTGSGAMSAQTFESNIAEALDANTFEKEGYTFAGWNTKADGSGTAYTDKQEVTFTPENDGDTVTLYAQWDLLPAEAPVITVVGDVENTYLSEPQLGVTVEKKNGYTYSYQWYQNTTNSNTGGTVISGAVGDGYRLPAQTPVGTYYYYCVVTAERTDNSQTNSVASRVVTVKLNPIPVDDSAVTLSNGDFTYNGQQQRPAVTVDCYGLPLNENVDYTLSWSDDCKNAGQKTVTVAFKGNYSGTVSKTYEIKQKEIGISWGATESLPYTGESRVPGATATGLVNDDICTLTTAVVETGEGAGVVPGKWTAQVIGLSNANYKLPADVTTKFSIAEEAQDTPQTGDESAVYLWWSLMAVSGAVLLGIRAYDPKKKKAKNG